MEYRIIHTSKAGHAQEAINQAAADGFILIGSVAYTRTPSGGLFTATMGRKVEAREEGEI